MRVASAKSYGGIFEQRIAGNFHLVIVNIGMQFGQADRLGIGDEMDFVSALGQFYAKFGGDHSAATIGRITGDSDLHPGPFDASL